jgi:hypothetical protein
MIVILTIAKTIPLIYVNLVRATITRPASRATDGFAASARLASMDLTAVSTSMSVHLSLAQKALRASMASMHSHASVRLTNEENDVKSVSSVN